MLASVRQDCRCNCSAGQKGAKKTAKCFERSLGHDVRALSQRDLHVASLLSLLIPRRMIKRSDTSQTVVVQSMSNNMKTREKQTRLDFTPIKSPSPQRHEAHIRVDETFSPTKKRKVGSKSSPHSSPNNQPPPFSQSRVQIIDHSPARTPTQLPTTRGRT